MMYKFGKGITEYETIGGASDVTNLLGGKGAKLAEMGALGLPVPPGVIITTQHCMQYLNATSTLTQKALIETLVSVTLDQYSDIRENLGYMPLVSVRSGARVSMPGMMDTILNVGINDDNLEEWTARLGEPAALDCYRRLIEMYGQVVIGIPASVFESDFEGMQLVAHHKVKYEELTGLEFPQSIEEQLAGAIEAVFKSWFSDRARAYRTLHGYPEDWGTAVTVQQMVFGNRNDTSASGVLFTRNPDTGEKNWYGDWLPNVQGEDVVAGGQKTFKIEDMIKYDLGVIHEVGGDGAFLDALTDLKGHALTLEKHYNDMQDIEFTIDDGELFILQTRDGQRSARAAFRIAYELYTEEMVGKKEALRRVSGKQYLALYNPAIAPDFETPPSLTGIPAAGSIVTGVAVFSSEEAIKCKEPCILVTKETTPEDFSGMVASVGILTSTGGITSHAAVVARGMDKTCVVGCEELSILDSGLAAYTSEGEVWTFTSGERITIDGSTGNVWVSTEVPVVQGEVAGHVYIMLGWVLKNDKSLISVTPESVPNEGLTYVDVSGALATITSLTAALKAAKVSGASGIIGFGKTNSLPRVDESFLGYFGVETRNHQDKTVGIIEKTLIKSLWTKKMKKAWTLHLPAGTEDTLLQVLRGHGWSIVTIVDSFKSALSVDGYIQMEDSFAEQLKREKMEFSQIEELMVEAGREVKELPERITKKRLVFDVLGG